MAESLDALLALVGRPKPLRTPRPINSDPTLERAINAVDKQFPGELDDVNIHTMPWDDQYAGTTVMGTTSVSPTRTREDISINPATTIAFPQSLTDRTLVHELQHVRQNRLVGPNAARLARDESILPYDVRPTEVEAEHAADEYGRTHGIPNSWSADLAVLSQLPKRGRK